MLRQSCTWVLLALVALASVASSNPAIASASVVGHELQSSARVGRTTFDYTYRIRVQNGEPALANAVARVTSSTATTQILDGEVVLGDLAANATMTSVDTFKIRQDRTVAFDPKVLIWVIQGDAVPPPIVVPDVEGQSQAAAESAITGAGLIVGVVTTASSATVAVGHVISQAPGGGSNAALGSAVNLVVSSGPALVTVPDVVGQPQAAAEGAIVAAGLTVGTVTTASNATVPAGSVISQIPSAGEAALSNSRVDLVVSLGGTGAPLEVRITSPEDQSFVDIDSVTVVGEVSDPDAHLTLNGDTVANDSGKFSGVVTLADGLNSIEVRAETNSGEVTTATIQVVFDPVSGGTVLDSVQAPVGNVDASLELPDIARLFLPGGSIQGLAELQSLDMPLVAEVAANQQIGLLSVPVVRIKVEQFPTGPLSLTIRVPDLQSIVDQGNRVELAALVPVGGIEGEALAPELSSLGGSPCENMTALCISLHPEQFLPNNPFDPNDPIIIITPVILSPLLPSDWRIWVIPELQQAPLAVGVTTRTDPITVRFNFNLDTNILLSLPLASNTVTSNFGVSADNNGTRRWHSAIDLRAKSPVTVTATHGGDALGFEDGVLPKSGNAVQIKAPLGFETGFAHLSAIEPSLDIKPCPPGAPALEWKNVKDGSVIGVSGHTSDPKCGQQGNTADHLHYTLKLDGATRVDPTPFFVSKPSADGSVEARFNIEHILDYYARSGLTGADRYPASFYLKYKGKVIPDSLEFAQISVNQPVQLRFQPGVSKDLEGNFIAPDFASGASNRINDLEAWVRIPRTGSVDGGKEFKLFGFSAGLISGFAIDVSGVATPAQIGALYPETTAFLFSLNGSPDNTCGGELGGPLYSVQVAQESNNEAVFYPGNTTSGVAQLFGTFANRRPCSTFLAIRNAGKPQQEVWANVTERRAQFSQFGSSDREYQLRYYSGDPSDLANKPPRCEAGSVNVFSFGGYFPTVFPAACEHRFLSQ